MNAIPEQLLHPVTITSALLALATLLTFLVIKRPRKTATTKPEIEHRFTFEDRELVAASDVAKDALSTEDIDEDIYNQLMDRLSDLFPELAHQIELFEEGGEDFLLQDVSTEGPISVAVLRDGRKTHVVVTGIPAPLSRKLVVDKDQALATEAELKTLRGTVETAPFPMWRENASGRIDWVNRAYLHLLETVEDADGARTWPPTRLFEGGTVVKIGEMPVPSRKMIKDREGASNWYDVTAFGFGENSLHFAVNANATAKAEESQRNFLQTLTQTFAYLRTGLAIFDRSRQLVLFNPALTDLTGLEPQWLILKPTLYDFLNQLREHRILPERKDFTDWRSKLSAVEQSVKEGAYSETWTLPTGQTYRMTGRPHPEGAIAFLFEDITAEIALTRKFRRELDLNQSIFDSLTDPIAVFAQDGSLECTNDAYKAFWEISDEDQQHTNVIDASKNWQKRAEPTPIWGDARDFVMSAGERSEWSETIWMQDGSQVECRFVPISYGSTMVSFRELEIPFAMPEIRKEYNQADISEPALNQPPQAKSA